MTGNHEKLIALGIDLRRSSGQMKVKCPKCSPGRKKKNDPCLSVDIDKGVYNCHNPGCDFRGTVSSFHEKPKKEYVKPEWTNNTGLSEKLVKWFKGRGISQQTLIKMNIGEGSEYMPQHSREMNVVKFPYFSGEEVVNIKYRSALKDFKMVSGAELVMYNLPGISGEDKAIIVEGEIDALSFIESDITWVVSVPNGASKGSQRLEYLDNCWHYFENMGKIYIGTDNDEPGIALRNELIRRLGDERCYIIDYQDCKDANEYLLANGKTSMQGLIDSAKPVPIAGIFTGNDLSGELTSLYENGLPRGEDICQKEFDDHITFVPGQLTVITGIPNHGKSDFVDHICTRLSAFKKWRFGVFSPENFPIEIHMSKLSEKVIGKSFSGPYKMSGDHLKDSIGFINDHFYFIRPADESFTIDNILELSRKLVLKHGINGLVIDPWNTIDHQIPAGVNETNYISLVLSKIIHFAQRYNLHIFLVAHPTKIKKDKNNGKYEIPTLYDISGSANFFNKAFNGFSVYRDFDKKTTSVFIQKVKFRHIGKVGGVEFRYNTTNGRYTLIDESFDDTNYMNGPRIITGSAMDIDTNKTLEPNRDFIEEDPF